MIGPIGVPFPVDGSVPMASATLPWATRYTCPMAALWAKAPLVPPKPVLGSFTGGIGVAGGGGLAFPPLPLTAGAIVAVAVGCLADFGVLVGTAGTGVSVGGAEVAVAVGADVLVATTGTTVPVDVGGAVVAVAVGLGKGAEAPSPPNRTCGCPASGSPVGRVLIGNSLPRVGLRSW
jgi:hypothetical protein